MIINVLNEEWHFALYALSGSSNLQEFIKRLWERYPWRTLWLVDGQPETAVGGHELILAALRDRDSTKASEAMRDHIRSGARDLVTDETCCEEPFD